MKTGRTTFTIAALGLLALGCSSEPAADRTEVPAAEATPLAAAPSVPDTTAAAVIAMLEEADYQDAWELWPEKGELYTGAEPHGMLLTTYLNGPAMEALRRGVDQMPTGAVLVKENYTPDSTFAAATVMVKQSAGYNPDHSDWWFMKRLADGTVEVAGRGEGCQSCHIGQAANDYIFTGPISGG